MGLLGFNSSHYAKVAATGERAGSATAAQLPDITAKAVNIKAGKPATPATCTSASRG